MESTKLSNSAIARLLREVSAAYEIKGENQFKVRAYNTAANSIEHATSELKDLWEEGRLDEIPGVGESIASHLDEYFRTGKVKHFDDVKKNLPPGMFAFFGLEGIGPKTAFKLAKELKVKDKEELLGALAKGKVAKLPGFGKKSEDLIRQALERRKVEEGRILLPIAFSVAEKLIEEIKRLPGVTRADPLGSLRRMVSTVGDIDIGVATDNPKEVVSSFTKLPSVSRVLGAGEAKASVVLKTGRQVDIRVHNPKSYGALLQYFTGSKSHNIHLRKIANSKGLSFSEYGVKKYKGGKIIGDYIPTENEEALYKLLDMQIVPPELREDTGEIEAAQKRKIPYLVGVDDIQGEVHLHTTNSDGEETAEVMVKEAISLGREYVGISDHAPSAKTRGMAGARQEILKRKKEVGDLRKKYGSKIKIFFGAEVNVDSQAKMALPDDLLKLYEYTIGSIHTAFNQPKDVITKRILAILENPYVNALGHPTGRLLGEREAYEVDWEKVFATAQKEGKALEINSYPSRLDLPDGLVKIAKDKNIKFLISTDAHRLAHYQNLKFGVAVARRGWCSKEDIVNSLKPEEFAKVFKVRG